MSKYLFYGTYTPEGVRGLLAEGGSGRVEAVKQALSSINGRLEAFYFSFGESDFYTIVDLPDNASTAAFSFTANAFGYFAIKTAVLLTPAEVDLAVKKSVKLRQPGL